MTTGKTIALTRWTLVGKVMSLHFNMWSRLVIAFLPRSKCLLISWLQSPCLIYIFSFILHNSGPQKALAHLTEEDADAHRASVTSTFCFFTIAHLLTEKWASLVAQMLKSLPSVRETWVRFLVQKIPWRRKWQPTPVFLPGKSHGWRSLAGYILWVAKSRTGLN